MTNFLIVTGPSGAGKTTVIEYLLKVPLFELSVSYTTRKPRKEEISGKHYIFVDRDEFLRLVEQNFFIEHTEFGGHLYGTPRAVRDEDKIVVFDVELAGLRFFKQRYPRAFFCLMKIDRHVMERRLLRRVYTTEGETTVDEEDFRKRMSSFEVYDKVEEGFEFNKVIDNSRSIEETLEQAQELIDEVIEYYEVSV